MYAHCDDVVLTVSVDDAVDDFRTGGAVDATLSCEVLDEDGASHFRRLYVY